jgi:hypothetical protein
VSFIILVVDAAGRQPSQCPNCECCAARGANKAKSFLSAKPKIHRRKPLPWNVCRSLKRSDLARLEQEGQFFSVPNSPVHTKASSSPFPLSQSQPISPSTAATTSSSRRTVALTCSTSAIPTSFSPAAESSRFAHSLPASPARYTSDSSASPARFATGSMLDALTSLVDDSTHVSIDCVVRPTAAVVATTPATSTQVALLPPLSPLSPYRDVTEPSHSLSASSSDCDSLPEDSPDRTVAPRKLQPLPTFDRPLNCGYPAPSGVGSFFVSASY